MKKKAAAWVLAAAMAFSATAGGAVPVLGGEVTASKTETAAAEIARETIPSEITGDYVEGEIIAVLRAEESDGISAVAYGAAGDLMEQAEDLMDVSLGAAAIEAEQQEEEGISAEVKGGAPETTVIRLIHSDRYSTKELLEMYKDYPGLIYAEPNYVGHIEEGIEEEAAAYDAAAAAEDYADPEPESELSAAVYGADKKDPDMTGFQYAYGNGPGGMDVQGWNDPANKNAEGTVVAVVDTGVDYEHEDLTPVMWDQGENYKELVELGGGKYGFNAAWELGDASSTDPMDVQGHGTHCAGIIAAAWNDFGTSGIANGAKIMAIRHTDTGGGNKTSNTVKGYNYIKKAKELGVNVVSVNNSWGVEGDSEIILGYSISELAELGIVSCFAASNEGKNNDIHAHTASTLADQPGGIMVGAVNNKGERAKFSDYGIRTTDIFAPGEEVMSTYVRFKSKTFPDIVVSPPMKDLNGETAADDFSGGETWFQIGQNPGSGAAFTVTDNSLQIRNAVLKPVAEMDEITRETVAANPPADGYIATICTLKPKAKLSTEKLISFALSAKTPSPITEITAESEAVRVYVKTKSGGWDRPTLTEPLESDYKGKCYDLEKGVATGEEFDLDDIEIRLVVFKGENTFDDIDVDEFWFTDAGKIPYRYDDGTSMATPAVAGELAVVAAAFPNDSAEMRTARILAGANRQDNITDLCITGGMANLKNSLDQSTYTPVINDLTTYWDGLHLNGYFLGEKANLEVTIKEGDLTFTTADGSLSVNEVFTLEDGGQEAVLSMPQELKSGEVTVTVRNKAKAPGRTDYTRIMTLEDLDGYLSPSYPQTPVTTDLNGMVPVNIVGWNGSLILTGMSSLDNEPESWIGYDGVKGTWSKLPTAIEKKDNGNVINWNQRLLYINNEGELCIHDPITGALNRGVLILKDRQIDKDEVSALYYDGERVLLAWTPINAATGEPEATQIWEVIPDTFSVKLLGKLKGSYGAGDGGMNVPIIAHTTAPGGKTSAYYIFGVDDLSEDDMAEMERFTTGSSLASAKVALKYPEGGEMVFSQVFGGQDTRLYTGCAFAGDDGDGAMMITGMFRVSDGDADNPVVLDDNYFINLNDSESELPVWPSSQKVSSAKLLNSVICAYEGKAYMIGERAGSSSRLYFASTPVPTWESYGDQVKTDTSVKLKKLTMSPSKVTIDAGQTAYLSAAPTYQEAGNYAVVVWTTSNSNVVTVDQDGTIHGINGGTAVITAACGDKTATCTVKVNVVADPELNKTETTLKEGAMDLLVLKYAYATGKEKITWKSSNKKIVTVSNGLLTAKKEGSAVITATWKSGSSTGTYTCSVDVTKVDVPKADTKDKDVTLSVSKSTLKVDSGKPVDLTATLKPKKGENYKDHNVVFKTTNPEILGFGDAGDMVTISGNDLTDKSGKGEAKVSITGRAAGTAYVVVESYEPAKGESAGVNRKLVKVTVNSPAESIRFTGASINSAVIGPNNLALKTGSDLAVYYSFDPEVCTNASKIKWTADKSGAVAVKNGVITAKKVTTQPATVTATCGNARMEIKVTVTD